MPTLALRNDRLFATCLPMTKCIAAKCWCANIGSKIDLPAPRPVQDVDITAIQEWFQLNGLPLIGQETVHKAVDLRAHEHSFHPVRDYLDSLQWDSKPRVETWRRSSRGGTGIRRDQRAPERGW